MRGAARRVLPPSLHSCDYGRAMVPPPPPSVRYAGCTVPKVSFLDRNPWRLAWRTYTESNSEAVRASHSYRSSSWEERHQAPGKAPGQLLAVSGHRVDRAPLILYIQLLGLTRLTFAVTLRQWPTQQKARVVPHGKIK